MKNFAKYLRSLRLERGFESVSDYLRKYKLPISGTYYRALESGGGTAKQITMDTAEKLCLALKLSKDDRAQFFSHLLKDLLPDDVFAEVIRPIRLESFGNLAERLGVLKHDLVMYERAMARARLADSFIPDESIISLFTEHPDWLPVIHFVYLAKAVSEAAIARVCEKNNIDVDPVRIVDWLVNHGVVAVVGADSDGGRIVARRLPIFRLPINKYGRSLKDRFILIETEASLSKPRAATVTENGTYVDAQIIAMSAEGRQRLMKRISDVLAEAAACSDTLGSGASPYFLSVIASARPNYCG